MLASEMGGRMRNFPDEHSLRTILLATTRIAGGAILASALVTQAAGQTVRLEDVVAVTLQSSVLVQREDERVRRAAGQLRQAQGAFDWTVNAETGWEQLYVPKARDGLLTNELDTPSAIRTTVGIGRRFRNGVEIRPGVSFYATDATAAQTAGLTTPRPALNLTIPLFQGRGPDNVAATAERAAVAALEGSGHARDFMAQRAVHDTVQVYWRCLAVRQGLGVQEADQLAAEDYVSSLRNLVQLGRLEPTLLDRAVAGIAVQRVGLSRAVSADEACRNELALAMRRPAGGDLPTAVGEFPAIDGMADPLARLNEQVLTDLALAKRSDLMALLRYDTAENERVRGARTGLETKVDVYVDPTRVLLRYSRSLGRDAEEGQISAAVAAQNEARINLEQAQVQVRSDVTSQLRTLREAVANWTELTQSVGLLENVVADARRRAQAEIISQQDFRSAQSELAQVRLQVIDARLQYAAGLARLRLATGTIEAGDGVSTPQAAAGFRSLPER